MQPQLKNKINKNIACAERQPSLSSVFDLIRIKRKQFMLHLNEQNLEESSLENEQTHIKYRRKVTEPTPSNLIRKKDVRYHLESNLKQKVDGGILQKAIYNNKNQHINYETNQQKTQIQNNEKQFFNSQAEINNPMTKIKLQRSPVYLCSHQTQNNVQSLTKQLELSNNSSVNYDKSKESHLYLNRKSQNSPRVESRINNLKKISNILEQKAVRSSEIFPRIQQRIFKPKQITPLHPRYLAHKNKTEIVQIREKSEVHRRQPLKTNIYQKQIFQNQGNQNAKTIQQVNQIQYNQGHKNQREQSGAMNIQKIQSEAREKFKIFFETVPRHFKNRNQQNLAGIIQQLQQFNPFFNRIDRVIAVCFLKMGRLVHKQHSCVLYRAKETVAHFYVILLGKVRLAMGTEQQGQKKISYTGQTLLEQMLFNEKAKRSAFQKCKVYAGTYLLEVRIDEYKKIRQELVHFGYRKALNEMESIIKRNFIVKNWIRNKYKDSSH